jgi:hypothetical protein
MPTRTIHLPLSIRQLADALSGTVHLGQLPPLYGLATIAHRVVFTPHAVQTGTVFWDLPPRFSSSVYCPEEAFLCGAAGVISPRRIEPWAGCFTIQVTDRARSLRIACQLARHQLSHSATALSPLPASR